MKIFNYTLTSPDCVISMPLDAEILSIHAQRDDICLWAKVNENAPVEDRRFVTYGTGMVVEVNGKFLGTTLLYQGSIVVHVFEVT